MLAHLPSGYGEYSKYHQSFMLIGTKGAWFISYTETEETGSNRG